VRSHNIEGFIQASRDSTTSWDLAILEVFYPNIARFHDVVECHNIGGFLGFFVLILLLFFIFNGVLQLNVMLRLLKVTKVHLPKNNSPLLVLRQPVHLVIPDLVGK
jgi:hypothetical protein